VSANDIVLVLERPAQSDLCGEDREAYPR